MSFSTVVVAVLAVAVGYYGGIALLSSRVPPSCVVGAGLAPLRTLGAPYPTATCTHPYGFDVARVVKDTDIITHGIHENNVTSPCVRRFSDYFQSFADNAVDADARYLVLELSATWCDFCTQQARHMAALAEQYSGFVFGTIFSSSLQKQYTGAHFDGDTLTAYADSVGLGKTPRTFCGWTDNEELDTFFADFALPTTLVVNLQNMQVHALLVGFTEGELSAVVESANRDGGVQLLREHVESERSAQFWDAIYDAIETNDAAALRDTVQHATADDAEKITHLVDAMCAGTAMRAAVGLPANECALDAQP